MAAGTHMDRMAINLSDLLCPMFRVSVLPTPRESIDADVLKELPSNPRRYRMLRSIRRMNPHRTYLAPFSMYLLSVP